MAGPESGVGVNDPKEVDGVVSWFGRGDKNEHTAECPWSCSARGSHADEIKSASCAKISGSGGVVIELRNLEYDMLGTARRLL